MTRLSGIRLSAKGPSLSSWHVGGALVGALVAAACTSTPALRPVAIDPLLPLVRTGDDGERLLAAVTQPAARGDLADARRTAETFANEFAAALRTNGRPEHLVLLSFAEGDPAAWTGWLQRGAEAVARTREVQAELDRCVQRLREGTLPAAASAASAGLARAETSAWRPVALAHHGFALAALGDADARAVLRTAADAALPFGRLEAARLHALRCGALGDADAWLAAVTLAVDWQQARPLGADPWLWRALLERMPSTATWPIATRAAADVACGELRTVAEASSLVGESEPALLWFVAAHQHRRRGEALAALAAFRRAQELGKAPLLVACAIAGQARALLAVQRSGDARAALLAGMTAAPSPPTAVLVAQLAAIELAEERPTAARELGEKALAMAGETPFPLRGQVLANLGVAACLLGDPEAGQARLLQARAEFVRTSDPEGLADCLANEEACAVQFQRGDLREVLRLQEELRKHGLP